VKKIVLGIALTLAALCLATSPAIADAGSPQAAPVLSAADQEFLASLVTPAPVLEAKRPLAEKSMCTASCGPYPSVTCSGITCSAANRNCSVGGEGNVKCDGVKTKCSPPCPDCAQLQQNCTTMCGGSECVLSFTCELYSCRCIIGCFMGSQS
jgi:hypothetical protein